MVKKPTLLIVNDNSEMLEIFSGALQMEGYTVVTAPDSATALELAARRKTLALAIVQLDSVKRGSIELCRRLHELSELPVIVLAAKYDDYDETRSFAAGAEDFIPKPVSIVELITRIKVALRRVGYNVTFNLPPEPSPT